MSNIDQLQSELELFESMVVGFIGSLVRSAKLIPNEKWNWSSSERTPTAREICEHAFMWLWCDRQQMTVLDPSKQSPIPDLPSDRDSTIRLLQDEAEEWRSLIRSLAAERLLENRDAFDGDVRNLRGFLFHMGQNLIYKVGQLSMLYYDFGLDGSGLYTAPYPHEMFSGTAPWPAARE